MGDPDAQHRLLQLYEERARSCAEKAAQITRDLAAGTWTGSVAYGKQQVSRFEGMAAKAKASAGRLREALAGAASVPLETSDLTAAVPALEPNKDA